MVKQEHGSRDIWEFASWPKSRRQREDTMGMNKSFHILKPVSSHTPPPAMAELLMLPKQFYQLVTKCHPHPIHLDNTKYYFLLNKSKWSRKKSFFSWFFVRFLPVVFRVGHWFLNGVNCQISKDIIREAKLARLTQLYGWGPRNLLKN